MEAFESQTKLTQPQLLLVGLSPDLYDEADRNFQDQGFRPVFEADGHQALDRLHELEPQAVLIDSQTLGLSSFAICEKIRRTPIGAVVPVVIIANRCEPEFLERGYKAGTSDFVFPGFNWIVLCRRIHQLLHSTRAIENLEQYRFVFDQTSDPMALIDTDYTYRIANESYAEAFQRPEGDIVGHSISAIHGRELFTELKSDFDQAAAGVSGDFRRWIADKSGKDRLMHMILAPFRSRIGNLTGVVVNLRDITVLTRTEERLRLRTAAVEAATDGIIISHLRMDQERVIYASPAFCKLTGYKLSELLIGEGSMLQGPGTSVETVNEIRTAIAEKKPFRGEILNYRKDGTPFWNFLRLEPLPAPDGKIHHYVGVQTDVTDRKRNEEQLRRHEVISSLTSDLMSLVSDDYHYLAVNQAYAKRFQMPIEQIVNQTIAELHGDDVFQNEIKPLLDRCLAGEAIHEQHWIRPPAGGARYIDVNQVPYRRPDGKIVGAAITTRDITALKEAEAALQEERSLLAVRVEERTEELHKANDELAEALRMKDAFLASMSHELRTPLNSILGMAEALQERDVFGALNERQLNALSTIENSGKHLLDLINDVLDIARVGAGELALTLEEVDPLDVCHAALALIKPAAKKKRHEMITDFDRESTTLLVDRRRLLQIIVNLLSNAVKFTPPEGKIGLDLRIDKSAGILTLSIWDTGIGIAADDLDRLFQPFVQLDNSLSRQYEGTGLGLSLAYNMTELHGGSVQVESEREQGSRFTITLPLTDAQPKHSNESSLFATVSKTASRQLQILVVDNNHASANRIGDFLTANGILVTIAHDGSEAPEIARQIKPDLILLDLQLPRVDGLETLRRLHTEAPGDEGPVIIAQTALALPGDRERSLQAGAQEYLIKPLILSALGERINELLRERTN